MTENTIRNGDAHANGSLSRRAFLRDAGIIAGGVGAMTAFAGCAPKSASSATASTTSTAERVTAELMIPEASAPTTTEYTCDVLVIGGGFAGINAAYAAKEAGASSVLLIDKGHPGYSGLSPFPSSFRWIDDDFGDDREAYQKNMLMGSEYLCNQDWYQVWMDESKAAYKRLKDWGILDQFTRAADGEYWANNDYVGYKEANAEHERRPKFISMLKANSIDYVDYTMITNVLTVDGKAVGAMGFHVPSGTVIKATAKAVVMCMGGGVYKSAGFPAGSNSFDGEYIAYNMGLPIVGKEFDDFHMGLSWAPGNAFPNMVGWAYVESMWLCGGDVTADTYTTYATGKFKAMALDRITKATSGLANSDGTSMEDQANSDIGRRGGSLSGNPDDPRIGKMVSPIPKGDTYGVATGMCAHLTSGVWCGVDDTVGATGVAGLYVAGDGMNGADVTGAMYSTGVGFTSSFCSVQGYRAGKAAAQYASGIAAPTLPADQVQAATAEINGPLGVTAGFSPDWARDQLHAIMAPYWIMVTKSDATLSGALTQIEYMRDNVVPKLMATTGHELLSAHEVKHKILSAEMKLRAGLERKESRGFHYRVDYPYRDDAGYLCYIACTKAGNGGMDVSKVSIKDSWKGDTSADYATRYPSRFPGEAAAKGIAESSSSGSSWSK